MDIEFINDKIKEWEETKQNCNTITMPILMQQMIDYGINNRAYYSDILSLYNTAVDKGRRLVSELDEIIKNDDMNKFNELINYDADTFMSMAGIQRKKILEKPNKSQGVKRILDSFESKSLDEIIQFYDNLNDSAKLFNKLQHVQFLNHLSVIKDSFEIFLILDELLIDMQKPYATRLKIQKYFCCVYPKALRARSTCSTK